jgi:hypothetical protein
VKKLIIICFHFILHLAVSIRSLENNIEKTTYWFQIIIKENFQVIHFIREGLNR